jgi:rhamnulokinase
MDGNTMFISSGTWSLAGIETTEPVINEGARRANFTNEAGASRTNRFLKNACELWIVQECRRVWAEQGHPYDYDDLIAMAGAASPMMSFIDPDHPDFLLPDDMPEAIRAFCRRTGQAVPGSHGSLIRTVLESMTLNYRGIIEHIETLADRRISRIQIVGGGSKNRLHCRFTANATGRPVVAGPSEATALGNIMVQAQALGHVSGLEANREIIGNSYQSDAYEPSNDEGQWDEAYFRFSELKRRDPS